MPSLTDLETTPDFAMDPDVASLIVFIGQKEGWFTGKRLSDYFGAGRAGWLNARRIINGTDRAAEIAKHSQAFQAALKKAGHKPGAVSTAVPTPPVQVQPLPAPSLPDAISQIPVTPLPLPAPVSVPPALQPDLFARMAERLRIAFPIKKVCPMAGGIIRSIIGGRVTGGAGPAIGAGISAALPSIADVAKIIVDRTIPDPNANAEAQRDIEAALAVRETAVVNATMEIDKAQSQVNLAEAQGNDHFSASWRPSVGWVCAAGFGYQFVLEPILTWSTNIIGVAIGAAIPVAPTLSVNDLMVVLTGILGLGVRLTVERVQGVPGTMPGAELK